MLNYEFPPLGGGAAPVTYHLSKQIIKYGHQVDIVTMHYKGLASEEFIDGIHVHRVKCLRKRQATCETVEMLSFVIMAFPFLMKLTSKNKYDIIHCHFIIPTGILAYLINKFKHIPYIITSHGSDIPGYNEDRFILEHKFTIPLLKLIIKQAAQLTTPSNYLKNLILKNVGGYDIKVIPNGIEVDKFGSLKKEKKILMTGRLLPRKGFHYVLEALKGIKSDYEVHIAGDGPYAEELKRIAHSLKMKVVFHGWLDNNSALLKELYETSAIYLLPSQRENASISLLEAMLAGMAVITSNVSGCPETVGDSGLLVRPQDVEGIRANLLKLINDDELCQQLGIRARKRVLEVFDWQKISLQYIEQYEEVVSKSVAVN
jgi:glycosyltransferase involved in cell wall biosynthesis